MKEYLVNQIYLEKSERINNNTINNVWGTITRVVEATNKEEALGKFMLQTQSVAAVQKLNPDVYLLSEVIRIK